MPPIIAVTGTKDTVPSSRSIAQPMNSAARPPKAVSVCLSHCMTRIIAGYT
jgi:hypothetical protein